MTGMKKVYRFFLFLLSYTSVLTQKTDLDTPEMIQLIRDFRDFMYDILGNTGDIDGPLYKQAAALNKTQQRFPPSAPFFCNVTGGRSAKVPTSVNRLRPGDIDVVAAMGDSLTAGAGLLGSNFLHILIENRGASSLGGGQATWREYLTLPNILKEFNPNLIGYATGDTTNSESISQLNVAFSGSVSADMPHMAKFLVQRMKKDSRIDLKNHWKFVTLWIGHNDFCSDMCEHGSPWFTLDEHKADIIESLRTLRDNLPRTVVAVIAPVNIMTLVELFNKTTPPQCDLSTKFECSCFFGMSHRSHISEYTEVIRRCQDLEEEICRYPEFHTNDFAAVFLPSAKGIRPVYTADGSPDISFLAPDCFHLSQKSDALFSISVWNNLLEPVGKKTEINLTGEQRFLCPSPENPYLQT